MSNTPSNQIPYVPENTTDPAAGLNLALDTVDALLQLAVIGIETAPPSGATDGDRYIVDAGATGDWSGEDGKVARYVSAGDYWQFHDAKVALNLTDAKIYINDAGWSADLVADSVDATSYKVSGTQVVGAQQSAIADSVGGDESTKINAILAALRSHGLIAT